MSAHAAQCRQASAVTTTRHLITRIVAITAHPFNVKLFLFLVCSLPKCSLFPSERNYASSLLPPEHTPPFSGVVPIASPSSLCLLDYNYPIVERLLSLCLISVSPVLPFSCGNGLFLLPLPLMHPLCSQTTEAAQVQQCLCLMSAALPTASTSWMWQAKGLFLLYS